MSENYIVINGKRAELTKEQMKQLGIEVKENKRWRAAEGCEYWSVGATNLVCSYFDGDRDVDDFRYCSHNYFRTKEEAETYARVLGTEMLLKKYADEHNGKFEDCKYNFYTNKIGSVLVSNVLDSYIYSRTIWFSSEIVAVKAIEEIGEERILEYLTYEW